MSAAACTCTLTSSLLAVSLMPVSMYWKKGLSRPLITAATLVEEVPSPPVAPPPEQPVSTSAATPRGTAMRAVLSHVASLLNIVILGDRSTTVCLPGRNYAHF
jgi:hypothetical protein